MFIDAQKFVYQNELKFFLLLKLMYREGKVQLNEKDLQFIEYVEQIKTRATTEKYIRLLLELGYIKLNDKTGYFILNSFDKIRLFHEWDVRLAFPIDYSNYYKTQAVTGAVIYSYLHKDFWRKVKREKSVQIKGSTYNFPTPTFNYKKQYAPVSVIGVNKIFEISNSTASRLKKAAADEKFIKLKMNFSKPILNLKMEKELINLYDSPKNIVFKGGAYHLQLIDTIYPLFYFIKRKKLKR
jgi:hypothetical protein